MAYTRPAVVGDAEKLAPYLRHADYEEIKAASGKPPKEVLSNSFFIGKPTKTIIGDRGNIIGMFGVVPIKTEDTLRTGVIWGLSTNELFRHKRWLVRHAHQEMLEVTKDYDRVLNFIYEKNTTHIRWLRRMGFNIHPTPIPYGHLQNMFYFFEKAV